MTRARTLHTIEIKTAAESLSNASQGAELKLNPDCRYYRGEKPCIHQCLCGDCSHYEPWKFRILIIKTAAMGDVLRTTSILRPLREKYPGAKITWLTGPKSAPLLEGNPGIDEVLIFDHSAVPNLLARLFDLVLSLDKSPAECGLATLVRAVEKRGMGLSECGTVVPVNPEADYCFSLGLSDELKFRENEKTHGEMILEVCGLASAPGPPELFLGEEERAGAAAHVGLARSNPEPRCIGLVVGAGGAFANKAPSDQKWAEIIEELAGRLPKRDRIMILGGPEDHEKMEAVSGLARGRASVVPPVKNVSLYAGVMGYMDVVVCGDTLALHMAEALGKPVVALFGPTCHQEIGAFGPFRKIVSPIDCAPCYLGECYKTPNCMDALETMGIADAVLELLR